MNINRAKRSLPDKILLSILVLAMTAAMCSCSGAGGDSSATRSSAASAEPVTGENYYLDTICTISIYELTDEQGDQVAASEAEDQAQAAIDDAFSLCAELDKTLSRTQDASEISAVNNGGGEWVEVSDDTVRLVTEGLKYSGLAGGDFDITIGGVTDLWDFHADPEDAKVPDADDIAEAITHVDYNNVEINGNMLRITDPDARIDLGGIAKGYIGDRMADLLQEKGVTSGIVNLGGNVICIGAKDNSAGGDDGAFVIGVETPFSDHTEIVGKIKAHDMTIVTSGVYERQIVVDGKRYHHILDTKTGYSAETDLDAVTLTAPLGMSMDIDALSTTCLIKGYEAASELIEGMPDIEAVFILNDGTIEKTSGMIFEEV